MTGEQKTGGLDGYPAWLETHRHTGEIRVALKRRADSPIMVSRWATIPLTPAEPAEARIRSLEAANNLLSGKLERRTAAVDAAEAKLARAVEGLRTARETLDAFDCALTTDRPVAGAARRAVKRIDQTLAALQETGEVG